MKRPVSPTRRPGFDTGASCDPSRASESDEVLEPLERQDLDDLAGGLGLDHDRLLGRRVEAGTGLGRRLVHELDPQQVAHTQDPGPFLADDMSLDFLVESIHDGCYLLLAQAGLLGQRTVEFGLRDWLGCRL